MSSDSESVNSDRDVTITVCQDGPLLVRGPASLFDSEGQRIARERATVALCRCGGTSIPPWCDSTHKKRKAKRR